MFFYLMTRLAFSLPDHYNWSNLLYIKIHNELVTTKKALDAKQELKFSHYSILHIIVS